MTQQDDITRRVLTDDEINDLCGWRASNTTMRAENDRALAREVESALLSKLRAPVADERDRNATISQVVGLCNRIPGATTWNAAQFMYDEMHRRAALASAPVACNCPGGNKPVDLHAPNCPVRTAKATLIDPYDGGTWLAIAPVAGEAVAHAVIAYGRIQRIVVNEESALEHAEQHSLNAEAAGWNAKAHVRPLVYGDAAPQASECECSRKSKAVSDSEAQL